MATTTQISSLRLLINQPDNVSPYTDVELNTIIDELGDLEIAASNIWTRKAATYADLVDVQEGSSRRALSSLHEQALSMATRFGGGDSGTRGRFSRTRPIERQ